MIYILKSPNGDTRTAQGEVSFEEFQKSNSLHRQDVKNMMNGLAKMIMEIGENHDYTKKEREHQFYKEFTDSRKNGTDFKKSEWYKYHIQSERHHLNARVPDDVNLLDVLEFISDCCCAGTARSGHVYGLTLSDETLRKAFENTCELVMNNIYTEDDE